MHGESDNLTSLFSYVGRASRIPDYLRFVRYGLSSPLIRVLLLQIFFAIRSERQLVERLGYDLMFR